ncbi:LamG-like jellyroll fold domain-containing protein [Luteolibacter soli]|uniref:LamG-like jellyroll fold domain-containing protein n=1 Tax=Luteolibacter soli TaxID=3135280 RepID=A0ABU9B2H3_9BACT
MKRQDEEIARLFAEDMEEAERSALAKRLEADPQALEVLGAHAVIEGLLGVALEDELTAERRHARLMEAVSRADQDEFLSGVQDKIRRHAWRNRIMAIAAMVVLGFSTWFFVGPGKVASVTRLETITWGGATPLTEGGELKPGTRLQFDSGLVELDMAGRGRMIVEGPADLELAEPMRSVLHRGRVLMRVTEAGHGYRLETSRGAVVDLGTEFGVSVSNEGVETHVLEGEVEAIPTDGAKVLLKKNDALRFDGNGSARIPADPGSFYTSLPPQRAGSPRAIHWPLEGAGSGSDTAELRGFPGGDYDMNSRAMEPGQKPAEVPGVFGHAFAFDGKGGYAESDFPGIGGREPRTVSFWVKVPQDFSLREGFGILSWGLFEGNNFGGVWQVSINPVEKEGPVGHLRVGAHGGQIIGATDLRDDQWHHVAVVLFEASQPDIGKHVLIYLDGKLEPISRRSLQELNTRTEGASHGVWLGRNITYNQSVPNHHDGGFFRGEVDEVFIFDTPLSQDEIRALKARNEMPR